MVRIPHGAIAAIADEVPANNLAHEPAFDANPVSAPIATNEGTRFDYLFRNLQEVKAEASLSLESSQTVADLIRLGDSMKESASSSAGFSVIPAAYTYLGQFIDHDITFASAKRQDDRPASCDFEDHQQVKTLPLGVVVANVKNQRQGILQLEVLYGDSKLKEGDLMTLGKVSEDNPLFPKIRRDDEFNDVPRAPINSDPMHDREALIGDKRNDNNLILSQLHVAFLRAHNVLVKQGNSFAEAQKLLRQHYHWIVLKDFLPRIADQKIIDDVIARPLFSPSDKEFFIPLEFSVAAYRFGHSMVSQDYYYSTNLFGVSFDRLLPLSNLVIEKVKSSTLPESRVIQWERFVHGGKLGRFNLASRISTQLVNPLFTLLDESGKPLVCEARLAVMDLLRGYMLRMPTGQAVAQELIARGRNHIEIMEPDDIKKVAKNANKGQSDVLDQTEFASRTPLWYYILAEAMHFGTVANKGGGHRLGPVGSALVAEVLIELVRRSPFPILSRPGANPSGTEWSPTIQTPTGQFNLRDLLQFAGVFFPNETN